MARHLPLLLALLACTGQEFDTSDDTGDTDTGDTDTGSGDTDTDDTDTAPPEPQNWDFETWSASDPPPGFTKSPTADWTVTEAADGVEGDAGAALTLTTTAGAMRRLVSSGGVAAPGSSTWRFHAWLRDDDPDVAARLEVQAFTAGNLGPTTVAVDRTSDGPEWAEYTLDVSTTTADTIRPRLRVEEVTGSVAGSTITTDAWAITRPHNFSPTDGVEDDVAVPIAGTPGSTMDVSAALNNDGTLYVATNKADLDSDHLLFLWVGPPHATAQINPPWDKGGLVAGPSVGGHLVVLVQEQSFGRFCEWLVWNGTHWQGPANDPCSGDVGGRLEGTIPLADAIGLADPADLPRLLYLSLGPWGTGTAVDGELKPEFQVPAGDGDALIEADEVLPFSRVPLLVGLLDEAP